MNKNKELIEQYEIAIDVYTIFEMNDKVRIAVIEALEYAIKQIKEEV